MFPNLQMADAIQIYQIKIIYTTNWCLHQNYSSIYLFGLDSEDLLQMKYDTVTHNGEQLEKRTKDQLKIKAGTSEENKNIAKGTTDPRVEFCLPM